MYLSTINRNHKQIEKAITFLVNAISLSGHNEKPVILHSIRVAMYLDKLGTDDQLIIAAFLHDLIEDSNAKLDGIKTTFGEEVAAIVNALSENKDLDSKKNQFLDSIDRTITTRSDALWIRAADILDNSDYYHLAPLPMHPWLLEKIKLISSALLEHSPNLDLIKDLEQKYNLVEKQLIITR